MFRVFSTYRVSLKSLVEDIARWESLLPNVTKKISDIKAWVIKQGAIHPESLMMREITGSKRLLYSSRERVNTIMRTYFRGAPYRGRYPLIDHELMMKLLSKLDGEPLYTEDYFDILATKYHLNRVISNHQTNDGKTEEQCLLRHLKGNLDFYFIQNYTQYLLLLNAVKKQGYQVNIASDDDVSLMTEDEFLQQRTHYLKNVCRVLDKSTFIDSDLKVLAESESMREESRDFIRDCERRESLRRGMLRR